MTIPTLHPRERVQLNLTRLEKLYLDLGPERGDETVNTAMEDVAELLYRAETAWSAEDRELLLAYAQRTGELAERIGLAGLAQVAADVAELSNINDVPALAACVARMRRVGESALLAAWDIQDAMI